MTVFSVEFTKRARHDRQSIFHWIATNSSSDIARRFVDGLLDECDGLRMAPMRGTLQTRRGDPVRIIGYKRTVSIVFTTEGDTVRILRLLYRGRDTADARRR